VIGRYKGISGLRLRARKSVNHQVEARIGCAILDRRIHLAKPESDKSLRTA